MSNEIILRKANHRDLQAILSIFQDAIKVMDSNGIHQWDSIYPSEEVISKDILNNLINTHSEQLTP